MSPVAQAYFFRGLMQHRTAKQVLEPIARRLRTGNSSDTVDRLFSSAHVNDLRLIAAVALIVVVWLAVIALVTATLGLIVDLTSVPGTPDSAASTLQAAARVKSGSTGHILHAIHVARGDFLLIMAPTAVAFAGILTWAYQVGSARLGVVDLFACEIDTLCRVTAVTDTVRSQAEKLQHGPAATSAPDSDPDKVGSRDSFSSQENYFPILDSNARDLQNLEAEVVVNITAFYTYMKAVRDSLRRLADVPAATGAPEPARTSQPGPGGAPPGQPWHDALRNVIYMLYLALESGRHAIKDLVEFEPDQTERTIVILISELSAYRFLREQYTKPSEMHYDRLILRGPEYQNLIPHLTAVVRSHKPAAQSAAARGTLRDDSRDSARAARLWLAAFQLLRELEGRYEELVKQFPLDCVATQDFIIAQRAPAPAAVATAA